MAGPIKPVRHQLFCRHQLPLCASLRASYARVMLKLLTAASLAILGMSSGVTPIAAEAQALPLQASDGPDQPVFALSSDPYFADAPAVLGRLAKRKAHKSINHFCAIGYQEPGTHGIVWVYWKEDNALILWEANTDKDFHLEYSNRYLHLNKDVVATEAEVAGSTYIVTRAWVHMIVTDCAARGSQFVIDKRNALH